MSRRLLFRLFAAAVPASDHVSDCELLRRFVATRDSAAFELLVRRHADAVWAAASRVLGNEADAEDVFQATFVALLRKAGAVRGACVGGWLHRVAVNAAMKLKASRERERPVFVFLRSLTLPARQESDSHELAAIVHQELARLPERYRLPVVLCDLEGQTHAEAAKALGWPVGSVSGRLSRARGILRDRLARRGLAAPAALVAVTAPPGAIGTAAAFASGTVPVSPAVSSLAEGVLATMRITKLKLTAAVLAATGLLGLAGVGTVYVLGQVPAPRPAGDPPPKAAEPGPLAQPKPGAAKLQLIDIRERPEYDFTAFPDLKSPEFLPNNLVARVAELLKSCPRILGPDSPGLDPTDDTYRRLLKAQLHSERFWIQKIRAILDAGRWQPLDFPESLRCLTEMRNVVLELWGNDPKVLIPWLEELVIMAKYFERFTQVRVNVGTDPPQFLDAATRHRLEAEAALWKAKRRG